MRLAAAAFRNAIGMKTEKKDLKNVSDIEKATSKDTETGQEGISQLPGDADSVRKGQSSVYVPAWATAFLALADSVYDMDTATFGHPEHIAAVGEKAIVLLYDC